MAEQINGIFGKIKEFWAGLSKKTKTIIKWLAAGVLVLALGLTAWLNVSKMGYKAIFPGMSSAEAAQVYATLLEMGVQPQIDDRGTVKVPTDQWDDLQYQLSAQGFPKTTLTYDIFSSMSGFTTTEFEKRVALVYQLQDRIQTTLRRWEGIEDAAVTITVPEESNFVWNATQQQESSASVTVTMRLGYSLSPQQVSAIKNHVASAVPKLLAKNVVVIDAATGVEPPSDGSSSGGTYDSKRLEFERKLEQAIEDNVKRLLVPTYGPNGVTAVAKVTVDYDKMMTERKEVLPQDDGNGVVSHIEEHYTVAGGEPAGGLVGEEDNTDVPQYPNLSGLETEDITIFDRLTDYDIGYVLTQIEKGEPILKEASIAVIVNDNRFDLAKEELLVDLISKSVSIEEDNIRVASLDFNNITSASTTPSDEEGDGIPMLYWIIGGAVLGVLLIALIVFLILRGRKKRKQEQEEEELAALEAQRRRDLDKEIADHKRMLQEEAQAGANSKETAITQEVRDFAERNPEVTANLIRSLMKEDR